MKKFPSNLLVCALVLLAVNSVFPQSGQAEKRLTAASGEYSFTVPAGFNSQQAEGGFGLTNPAQTVIVAVKSHAFETFEKFNAQANVEADGFTRLGNVQDVGGRGKTFRVYKANGQDYLIVDTFVMLSPYGGGTMIVAFSNLANHETGFQTGLQVANSVTFTRPQVSDIETQWQTYLRGKHLLYIYNGNGYSETRHIYLCPSGAFYSSSEALSNSINGSGGVGSNSSGTWKVLSRGELKLILQFNNGSMSEYTITLRQANDGINLNGNRYFVETYNGCQ